MSDLIIFKSTCKDKVERAIELEDEWVKLRSKQKQYGKLFEPISKIFSGKFCPNCNTKLSVIKGFAKPLSYDFELYSTVSILVCNECGYKFAYKFNL